MRRNRGPRSQFGVDERTNRSEAWVLIRRGRPAKAAPKEAVNIRLDPDVLAYFRATGPGWQSRINEALRKAAGL